MLVQKSLMLETQFSLSERVVCICHMLTMSASSTISHQEAEFAASAMKFVFKLPLTFLFSIFLFIVSQFCTCFYFHSSRLSLRLKPILILQVVILPDQTTNQVYFDSSKYCRSHEHLSSSLFTSDASCQLYISWLNHDSLSMQSAEICIFK